MATWERLRSVDIDPALLPTDWELIRDRQLGHLAVIGFPASPRQDRVNVVIRIDYAISPGGADLRHMVGSAIAHHLAALVGEIPPPSKGTRHRGRRNLR
jgi:hypothetical protein